MLDQPGAAIARLRLEKMALQLLLRDIHPEQIEATVRAELGKLCHGATTSHSVWYLEATIRLLERNVDQVHGAVGGQGMGHQQGQQGGVHPAGEEVGDDGVAAGPGPEQAGLAPVWLVVHHPPGHGGPQQLKQLRDGGRDPGCSRSCSSTSLSVGRSSSCSHTRLSRSSRRAVAGHPRCRTSSSEVESRGSRKTPMAATSVKPLRWGGTTEALVSGP